ncbi:hamartin [Belonocnema kinseyi]|uniref:hamartin n=1 Tax=Belonocnema kinseyi TaxID=2817044 RepID=UPI00143CDE9C|nr:hamartin [Belonocnema kinseyi]
MSNNTIGVQELLSMLESNKSRDVDETKKVFHDHFLSTKDNWLVNGLFDYYLSTNSVRATEVLAGVREPHDKHLFDRLTEALVKPSIPGQKLQTLTLLGHVVRKQPTWLYKLANHTLFKELLKLLKLEGETLSLMSALLLLVTLLPMLPVALGPHLHDIFEVFARLASFYYIQSTQLSSSSNSASADREKFYLLHFQVGLYSLFHRLYAMYPCNFFTFLKQQYQQNHASVFSYIVKPMLESVRMHPLLITMSKSDEISPQRWKKMEHHDVVAECGRFDLDRDREEIIPPPVNSRFTPNPDHSYPPGDILGEDDTFWSPSMAMPPHSPPPLQTQPHEIRSTPSTPGNKIRTSPPEAAVEATPETTPVKDSRQIPSRQPPIGSSAARALGIGNGMTAGNSRPSTPNSVISSLNFVSGDGAVRTSSIVSSKLEKIQADRLNAFQFMQTSTDVANETDALSEVDISRNGKNDSWQEDQEVSHIVSAREGKSASERYLERRTQTNDVEKNTSIKKSHPVVHPQTSKEKPGVKVEDKTDGVEQNASRLKQTQEAETQTTELFPYDFLFKDVLNERNQEVTNPESRLSPTTLLDRFLETIAHSSKSRTLFGKAKQRRKGDEDTGDENVDEDCLHLEYANEQLILMQMQLQFERQRREVHAERNRRLLGKLRDSRVFEEHTVALNDRLRILEKETDALRAELERSKIESRAAEERYTQALRHWQSKSVEEQKENQTLKDRLEIMKIELKSERKKVSENERKIQSLEANVFDAGHQLKEALKTANQAANLKTKLNTLQTRFLMFREAQMRLQRERTDVHNFEAKDETVELFQRSYAEEIQTLRRQVETGKALVEAYRCRLGELENKEARKETQLIDQQRLLLEAKERHEAELQAVESKYKAQMEMNLLLQGRILELHGKLEAATPSRGSKANLASSSSLKANSSVASSSEGSSAVIPSNFGAVVNDCCDSAGEILNLHGIVVQPPPSPVTTPTTSSQHR